MRSRLALLLLAVGSTVGCDRVTKEWAFRSLRSAPAHSYLGDTIRIVYAENRGAFLGMGSTLAPSLRFWAFTVGSGLLLLTVLAWALRRKRSIASTLAVALVFGGGLGNLLDRAMAGGVIDFLNVGIGGLRTGIFNVADMAILLGGALFFLSQRTPRLTP
jgi:signal peptidase II